MFCLSCFKPGWWALPECQGNTFLSYGWKFSCFPVHFVLQWGASLLFYTNWHWLKRGKFSISQVGGPGLLIWTLLLWYLIIHLFLFPVTNVKIFEIPLSLIGTILSICKEPGFLCIFKCCSWNNWVINILENLTLFGDSIVKHGWEVKWYFQNDRPFADKDSFKQCYTCINKQNHLLLCNSTNTSWS